MAKGGSGFAALIWKARRSALNSAAPWPGPQVAQERVLGIQRKLHKWAEDDQDRRFTDLHNLVCDPATLMVAWYAAAFFKPVHNIWSYLPHVAPGALAPMDDGSRACFDAK
jgi:hypothetical protein